MQTNTKITEIDKLTFYCVFDVELLVIGQARIHTNYEINIAKLRISKV